MAAYQDIYSDLPTRVFAVWQKTKSQATTENDLSVTAMLMAAATGLAMPFEHLKDVGIANSKRWQDHPMFHHIEHTKYKKTLQEFDRFFKQSIQSCPQLSDATLFQCQELRGVREAALSNCGDATMNTEKYDVRFAVKILRNALAHNNILSIPESNEIMKLAFFSSISGGPGSVRNEGWNVLIISIQSFEKFLNKWFELLKVDAGIQGAALAIAGAEPQNKGPSND